MHVSLRHSGVPCAELPGGNAGSRTGAVTCLQGVRAARLPKHWPLLRGPTTPRGAPTGLDTPSLPGRDQAPSPRLLAPRRAFRLGSSLGKGDKKGLPVWKVPGSRLITLTCQGVFASTLCPRGRTTLTLEHTGEEVENGQQGALSSSRGGCGPSAQTSPQRLVSAPAQRSARSSAGKPLLHSGSRRGRRTRAQLCLPRPCPGVFPTAWAPAVH